MTRTTRLKLLDHEKRIAALEGAAPKLLMDAMCAISGQLDVEKNERAREVHDLKVKLAESERTVEVMEGFRTNQAKVLREYGDKIRDLEATVKRMTAPVTDEECDDIWEAVDSALEDAGPQDGAANSRTIIRAALARRLSPKEPATEAAFSADDVDFSAPEPAAPAPQATVVTTSGPSPMGTYVAGTQPAQAAPLPRDAFAWLVERAQAAEPHYIAVVNNHGGHLYWDADPNKALRFARCEDGEAFFSFLRCHRMYLLPDVSAVRVTEHGWIAPPAAQAAPPEPWSVTVDGVTWVKANPPGVYCTGSPKLRCEAGALAVVQHAGPLPLKYRCEPCARRENIPLPPECEAPAATAGGPGEAPAPTEPAHTDESCPRDLEGERAALDAVVAENNALRSRLAAAEIDAADARKVADDYRDETDNLKRKLSLEGSAFAGVMKIFGDIGKALGRDVAACTMADEVTALRERLAETERERVRLFNAAAFPGDADYASVLQAVRELRAHRCPEPASAPETKTADADAIVEACAKAVERENPPARTDRPRDMREQAIHESVLAIRALKGRFTLAAPVGGHEPETLPTEADFNLEAGHVCTLGGMNRSLLDYARAVRAHVEEEQRKPLPDNGVIALLCDSLRLAWGNLRLAGVAGIGARPLRSPAPIVLNDEETRGVGMRAIDHQNTTPHEVGRAALAEVNRILSARTPKGTPDAK